MMRCLSHLPVKRSLMLVVLVFMTVQCGGPAPTKQPEQAPTEQVVEITYLTEEVNEWGADLHAQWIAEFEAAHPNIKVNVVNVSWDDLEEKLTSAAAGGVVYDVFFVENAWISSLVKLGYIEDLDPWLERDPDTANKIYPAGFMRLGGKTRGLCFYMIPYQFAYNESIFEEKGLQPPTNWDEFVQVEKALRDEGTNTYGISLPLQDGGYVLTRLFDYRLAQEGGQLIDKDGNVVFNSPEGVAALQWWVDFYNMGLATPGSFGENQTMAMEFFGTGQTASYIDGPFVLGKAKQMDPNIRVAYAPAWKAKTGGYSWACSGLTIAANSTHKEQAWEFFKWIYSDQVSVKWANTLSLVFATKAATASLSTSDNPMLRRIPEFSQDETHNVSYPVLPEAEKLIDALSLAFQQALVGDKDAKTALDEAAAVWTEVLSQYK
jgi:multiple sugar transport system substrate-binding protein